MRIVAFHQSAFEQYNEWALSDKKAFERLVRLITETAKTPFTGIGKPEPLKRELCARVSPLRDKNFYENKCATLDRQSNNLVPPASRVE